MIDWDRIEELKSEVGEEDFAEVLEIFLEEVEEVMTTLQSGISSGQYESTLHFLKGSAMNLGFQALAELCKSGERHSAEGQFDRVDIGQVIMCYNTSKTAFQERIPLQSAA